MKKIAIGIIRFYKRYVSRGYYCRFVPSCSEYMMEAVEKYGVTRGGWMGLKRLLRCNRWSKGGEDLVE